MRLHEHSYKPRPRFKGSAKFHLGIELEVEAPSREARIAGLNLSKKPHFFYAKYDGSLNDYGWELISHPVASHLWLEQSPKKGPVNKFLKLVRQLREMDYRSHEGGSCGFHVHISRTAFSDSGNLNCCLFYWFQRLMNGTLAAKISQREQSSLSSWARQRMPKMTLRDMDYSYYNRPHRPVPHAWSKHSLDCIGTRYLAVNITNSTVEVRLFRGNLREDRIRKNMEFVLAAIAFAATRTSKNWRDNLDGSFVKWIASNRSTYPNLYGYLVHIGITGRTIEATELEDNAVCV